MTDVDVTMPPEWAGGEMNVLGRLASASNATFLVEMTRDGADPVRCVHKPVAGERPLWDFPDGNLADREYACFRVSELAGFDVVPPTTVIDGPFGPGMLQKWIDADDIDQWVSIDRPGSSPKGWFEVLEAFDGHDRPVVLAHADHAALRRIAVFDAVINNSDRKGLHLLPTGGADDPVQVWGIDHGVTLHTDDKLRTILWGWAGSSLTAEERDLIDRAWQHSEDLSGLVTEDEIAALELRCELLLETGILPEPSGGWPSIPWPPM